MRKALSRFMVAMAFGLAGVLPLQAQSNNTANPFNQYMTPVGGVDLFSGNAVRQENLLTFTGGRGLSLGVTLSYSSNIYLQVRSHNRKTNVGPVGLGWKFGFGQILCNHNGTGYLEDDEYTYISPEGVSQRILSKLPLGANGQPRWFLERQPYWKVERVLFASGNPRVKGWILTDISGVRYIYGDNVLAGDPNPDNMRSATNYLYANFGQAQGPGTQYSYYSVGIPLGGSPDLYPIAWSMAEIRDLAGGFIKLKYEQFLQNIVTDTWSTPKKYTKYSNIDTVFNSEGDTIAFDYTQKDHTEFYDENIMQVENPYAKAFNPNASNGGGDGNGDAFGERFNPTLLSRIKVINRSGDLRREYLLGYEKLDPLTGGKGSFRKSLLTQIRERAPKADGSGTFKKLGETFFEYIPEKGEDFNYGALKKVTGDRCGSIEYEYVKQQHKGVGALSLGPADEDGVSYGGGAKFRMGNLKDGSRYFMVAGGGVSAGKLWLYHLDGETLHPIIKRNIWNGEDLDFYSIDEVFPFPDYAVILGRKKNTPATGVFVLNYVAHEWVKSKTLWNERFGFRGISAEHIHGLENSLFVAGADWSDYVSIKNCRWDGEDWTLGVVIQGGGMAISKECCQSHASLIRYQVGNNFLVANWDDGDNVSSLSVDWDVTTIISNFDGKTWKNTSIIKNQDNDNRMNVVDDYIVHHRESKIGKKNSGGNGRGDNRGGSTSAQVINLGVLRWSGEKWVDGFNNDMPYWTQRSYLGSGEDYFLNRSSNKESIYHFNWDGSQWNFGLLNHYGHGGSSGGNPGRGFATVLYGHKKWNGIKRIQNYSQLKIFTHDNTYNWELGFYGGMLGNKHEKTSVVGEDLVVIGKGGESTERSTATGIFHYDGIKFHKQENFGPIANAYPCGPDCYKEVGSRKDRETYYFDFQGKVMAPFYAYKVSRKIIEDGVSATGKAIYEYRYSLDDAKFNRMLGTAMHRKVSVLYPEGNGRTVTKFHNEPEGNIKAKDRLLYGMIEEVSDYKQGDYKNPIRISRTGYEVFYGPEDGSWPKEIKLVRPVSEYTNTLGLEMTTSMEFNGENGLQNAAVMTNSDDTKKRTETKYAFELGSIPGKPAYGLFRTNHQLSLTAETKTLEVKPDGASKVVAAGTQTYRSETGFISGISVPVPEESFVYNDKDGTGFKEFRYDDLDKSKTENWESLGKVNRLDEHGHIIQTENVFGVKSTSLVGKGTTLPMAQILNAGFEEVGIFTGDYPILNDAGSSFDTKNKWFKGGAEIKALSPSARNFQEAAIFVQGDDSGPFKNLSLSGNSRPYTFSVWVYSTDVNVSINLKVKGQSHIVPIGAQNSWRLVSISLTAAEASGSNVQIQVAPGNGKEFYASDIRFFPQGARVITNYYSSLLDLPTAQVGEDNTFSAKDFDEFGRVFSTYGQKPTGEKILLSTFDYVDNGCPVQPFSDKLKNVKFRCEEPLAFTLDPLSQNNTYDIKLPATCDLVSAKIIPQDNKAGLVVKVDGTEVQTGNFNLFGNWIPFIAKQTGVTTLILEVNGNPYTFNFTRSSTCWSYYDPANPNYSGTQGDNPSLALQGNGVPVMALSDLLNRKKGFAQLPVSGEAPFSTYRATDISLQLKGTAPYEPVVSYLEHVPKVSGDGFDKKLKVRRYIYQPQQGETQGWASYGSEVATGTVSLPSLALMNGNPVVAYVDDLARETINEGPVVLGANFFVDDSKLEIAFSKPINDASWNAAKQVRISTNKGVTQTVTLGMPHSIETGEVANDELLVLNVSEAARAAIKALDSYPVELEIEVASGLAKSVDGAKDNQAATFGHKITVWVTQNIDYNEKKPTLVSGEILRDEMLLELRFNESIRDNTFNNALTLRLSTDNGGGGTISIPVDGRFSTRSLANDNTIGISLESSELVALENLANVGSALELELPQGLIFDEKGEPNLAETFLRDFHVAYDGVGLTPSQKTRLFVKKYQKNPNGSEQWIGLGDGNGDGNPDGLVSEFDASSVSLAVSALGVPFVAYVGEVEYKCSTDPSSKCFDGGKSKFILKKQVIVKKWNAAAGPNGAWVSVTSGIPGGDILDVNGPSNVKLRVVGEIPYILYDYLHRPAQVDNANPDHPPREETGEYALVMRKFDPIVTVPVGDDPASHWVAISDFGADADEDEAPIFYKNTPKGNFDFVIKNDVPYAAFTDDRFTRTNGMSAATVIKYAAGKWNSLGTPDFIRLSASQSGAPLALAVKDDGTPVLAAINERTDTQFPEGYAGPGDRTISLYKFTASSSCTDPSFNGLVVKDKANGTVLPLNWPFKQYFLNYRLEVENGVDEVTITPSANKCVDLKRVSHENDGLSALEFWPPTNPSNLCNINPIGPLEQDLTLGDNLLRVRGWDPTAETQVEYGIQVVRKESSTPTALAFEITTSGGEVLDFSPAVVYQGNVKNHIIEDVGNSIQEIRIKALFGSNTRVTLNGTMVATNINYPIALNVKENTINLEISVGGISDSHTLKIYRQPLVPDPNHPPVIVSVVKITDPLSGMDYHPVLITDRQYVIKAPGNANSVIISNAVGNTCTITAGASDVEAGGVEILLTGEKTQIIITQNCGGVKTEFQVVVIRDPRLMAKKRYIVGHQELGDPPGFYSFQSLKEAQQRLQDFSMSQNHYLIPKVFDIYVVADRGTDIISSDPTVLIPFANSTGMDPSEGNWNGVMKDSQAYQQLVDEFNSQSPVP